MPLTVNVGISRKASANYQSAGVSIHLTAELDQGLLADPPRLQQEIDRIYAQAEQAVDRKVNGMKGVSAPEQEVPSLPQPAAAGRGPQHRNGSNGSHSGTGNARNGYGGPVRPATESQAAAPMGTPMKRSDPNPETQRGCASPCEPAQPRAIASVGGEGFEPP